MESRGNVGGAGTRQTMVAELQLCENQSGERGPAEPGREGAHLGCPKQLIVRQSSPWHWTGRELDGGRRTGGGALCTRGQSEGEGERVWQRAQMGEGRWASEARDSKGAWGLGRGQRTHGRGRVHGGEIVGGRLGTS
jgi:hypothetical protein